MRPETLTSRVGAGLSTAVDAAEAGAQAAQAAAAGLGGGQADLVFVFLSPSHLDAVEAAVDAVRSEFAQSHLLGCVAEGVIAGTREVEEGPGVAVWAGSLPGAEIDCFHAVTYAVDGGLAVTGFPELGEPALVALLVDPFTFPAGPFLARLNTEYPGLPFVGGIASGGGQPGAQALVVDEGVRREGIVGAVVRGVPVTTIVSQGCAPIGREAVITKAEGNVVYELAGERALDRLRNVLVSLSGGERELAARGILAGLVIDENRAEYGAGDYLMRGLLGADEASGALALGEPVRVGQTLRFHVRDASSADVDLTNALERGLAGRRPVGALLFTCNGRGTNMFPTPDHDARVVGGAVGSDALAGFFCGGEIGPVGGQAFLHGFTATIAVFLES
jgi:small ligand-binding sensory domain FIST